MDDEQADKLALQPPEPKYISEKHVLKIPITDVRLKDPWKLRVYAQELLQNEIGDEVQVTDVKVKKPGLLEKSFAKMSGRVPQAKLVLTVKF